MGGPLGLAPNEIADFKEFWLPKMATRPFAAVRFVSRAEFDATAPLTVVPRPDSVIRVLIDYRSLDAREVGRRPRPAAAARRAGRCERRLLALPGCSLGDLSR